MKKQKDKDVMAELLLTASAEIERLRRVNTELGQYRDHTERMLALFEGGPQRPGGYGQTVDVAWKLRQAADGLRAGSKD